MAITLTSTTESTENLQHGVSANWETPPPSDKPEDSASTNHPEKLSEYIERRNDEAADRKDAARAALDGQDRYRSKGSGNTSAKFQRRIDTVTKNWRDAERRVKELEAQLGSAPAPVETPAQTSEPIEPQAAPQPKAQPQREQATKAPNPRVEQMRNEGRRKYTDFDAVVAEADRSGFRLPTKESVEALKNLPNGHDVMYVLAKNPQARAQMSANPQQAAEVIHRLGGVLHLESLTNPASWESFNARVAELGSNKDFNPRLLLDLPEFIRPAITDEGRTGADILLNLSRNPQLAREISQMRPDAALKRLGQISAQVTSKPKVKAPEPISPVGGSSSRTGSIPLDQLPGAEYVRVRNAEVAARKRGR